jgi:hypothetical protein
MTFGSIPVRLNGQKVDASWFNSLRTAGSASSGWEKITVTHTQLQAAALTNDIELLSLASNEVISGVVIKHSTAFAGTGITNYTLSVGISTDLDKYQTPFDVDQTVSDSAFDLTNLLEVESFASTTSVRLSAVSVGANLDQSSAGSVDVWISRSLLP